MISWVSRWRYSIIDIIMMLTGEDHDMVKYADDIWQIMISCALFWMMTKFIIICHYNAYNIMCEKIHILALVMSLSSISSCVKDMIWYMAKHMISSVSWWSLWYHLSHQEVQDIIMFISLGNNSWYNVCHEETHNIAPFIAAHDIICSIVNLVI